MKAKYSLWASDARVLKQRPEELVDWQITVRSKHREDNHDLLKYGYVWLSDHEQEVVLPRLEDRMEEISAAIQEKIAEVHAEAFKQVRTLEQQLQNLLALSYEGEYGDADD